MVNIPCRTSYRQFYCSACNADTAACQCVSPAKQIYLILLWHKMYFAKAMAFPLRTSSGDRGQHSAVLTVNFPPQISANTQLNSAQTRWPGPAVCRKRAPAQKSGRVTSPCLSHEPGARASFSIRSTCRWQKTPC